MNSDNDLTQSQAIGKPVFCFHLIFLDRNSDDGELNEFSGIFEDLKDIVHSSHIFSRTEDLVNYITGISDEEQKAFIIYRGESIENVIAMIQDLPQVDSMYILRQNSNEYKEWKALSSKLVYKHVDPVSICKSIQQTIRKYYQDHFGIPYLQSTSKTSKSDCNELEPSFMYTFLIREIFLELQFEAKHFQELINYFNEKYCNDSFILNTVKNFANDYCAEDAIRWYTKPTVIYEHVNAALRTMNVELIIKFDFFIRDLHQQIVRLHDEQYRSGGSQIYTVYRGQVIPPNCFDKLRNAEGGLLSFNNFLSTSLHKDVALMFADPGSPSSENVGVLFRIVLDSSIQSSVFANVKEQGRKDEEEVLFSMHSIFRCGKMKKRDQNSNIWEVDLTLTTDTDEELVEISKAIREETKGANSWERLGHLLIKMHLPQQAKLIYENSLENAGDDNDRIFIYPQLAIIHMQMGDLEGSKSYLQRSEQIYQAIAALAHSLSEDINKDLSNPHSEINEHPEIVPLFEKNLATVQYFLSNGTNLLATATNNMGVLYARKGEFLEAIQYYKDALKMRETLFPSNDSRIAASCINLGEAHANLEEYSIALSYLERALSIQNKSLPKNHPETAATYNNLGSTYRKMGKYEEALLNYNQALQIQIRSVQPNHPDLATSYNNIGEVCIKIGDYDKAENNHKQALKIRQEHLSENHPDTAISYNNLASTYMEWKKYSSAIECYEKAIEIFRENLPSSFHNLTNCYRNRGKMLYKKGDYGEVISCYPAELLANEHTPPIDPAVLVDIQLNIGSAHLKLADYPKALSFFEKALEIEEQSAQKNYGTLAICYDHLGAVYLSLEDYDEAIRCYEKSIEIQGKISSEDTELADSLDNLGVAYRRKGKNKDALRCYKKALPIHEKFRSKDDPKLAVCYNNIGLLYYEMGVDTKSLSFCERALEILRKALGPYHPDLTNVLNNIGLVYSRKGAYLQAVSHFTQAIRIQYDSSGFIHPQLAVYFSNIASLHYDMSNYWKAKYFVLLAIEIDRRRQEQNYPETIRYRHILNQIEQAMFVSR